MHVSISLDFTKTIQQHAGVRLNNNIVFSMQLLSKL